MHSDETRKKKVTRRSVLSLLGWGGIAVGCLAALGALGRFLVPTVSYGAPSRVKIGKPEDYVEGVVKLDAAKLLIVRSGSKMAAISAVCTHLGCVVGISETGFDCPCHGSRYDRDGNVTGGPAPRHLDWFSISRTISGELEVDKSQVVELGTFLTVA